MKIACIGGGPPEDSILPFRWNYVIRSMKLPWWNKTCRTIHLARVLFSLIRFWETFYWMPR